jgi:hypothetical protein
MRRVNLVPVRSCALCGCDITPKRPRSEYCSKQCGMKACYERNPAAYIANAREYYHANREAKVAYSRTYYVAHREDLKAAAKAGRIKKAAERPSRPPKSCDVCGSSFTPRNGLQLRCSRACAAASKFGGPPVPRPCGECGTVFMPARTCGRPQVYCSEECQRTAYNAACSARHARFCQQCGDKLPFNRGRLCKVCRDVERLKTKRDVYLRQTYGITTDDYDCLLNSQGGVCAICQSIESGAETGVFHVDHDHETGSVRGLLCCRCNQGLGLLRDNASALRSAAAYVERSRVTV